MCGRLGAPAVYIDIDSKLIATYAKRDDIYFTEALRLNFVSLIGYLNTNCYASCAMCNIYIYTMLDNREIIMNYIRTILNCIETILNYDI